MGLADQLNDLYADMLDGIDLSRWVHRENFDPMHSMLELRAAAKAGMIELSIDKEQPERTKFRFTPQGWMEMAKRQMETA